MEIAGHDKRTSTADRDSRHFSLERPRMPHHSKQVCRMHAACSLPLPPWHPFQGSREQKAQPIPRENIPPEESTRHYKLSIHFDNRKGPIPTASNSGSSRPRPSNTMTIDVHNNRKPERTRFFFSFFFHPPFPFSFLITLPNDLEIIAHDAHHRQAPPPAS